MKLTKGLGGNLPHSLPFPKTAVTFPEKSTQNFSLRNAGPSNSGDRFLMALMAAFSK